MAVLALSVTKHCQYPEFRNVHQHFSCTNSAVLLFIVPGKPLNVTIGEVNDSTIALSWAEPENPNGVIKGYRIYFMRKNFTDVQTVRSGDKFQKFILTDLGKFS